MCVVARIRAGHGKVLVNSALHAAVRGLTLTRLLHQHCGEGSSHAGRVLVALLLLSCMARRSGAVLVALDQADGGCRHATRQ